MIRLILAFMLVGFPAFTVYSALSKIVHAEINRIEAIK